MLGTLIAILITLVVLGVLFWALNRVLAVIPMEEPFRTLVYVVLVVIAVLVAIWVMLQLLGLAGVHVPFGLR